MAHFALNICYNKGYGFGNQIYSLCGMCSYALEHKIKYIYLDKFLREIHTDNYCNISEIIDLHKTNSFLKKYDITLIDGNNLCLKIISINYGNDKYYIDITNELMHICLNQNLRFCIKNDFNLDTIKGNPYTYFYNNYYIKLKKDFHINITYSINDNIFNDIIMVENGLIKQDYLIDLQNIVFNPSVRYNNGSIEFYDVLEHIIFNTNLTSISDNYIKDNIDLSQQINTIHLRLEDDAIKHWATENGYTDLNLYKNLLENIYIENISKYINKNDITLFISGNYDNNVIKYMIDNNYKFILTPKFCDDRDVSAIIDLHIGQYCNNVYIGVFESTFSYALLTRINNKPNVNSVIISFILPISP